MVVRWSWSSTSHIWIHRYFFYNAVITFSLKDPVYIIELKEKGRAIERLFYIYGHNIAIGKLNLQGNCLHFDKTLYHLIKYSKHL